MYLIARCQQANVYLVRNVLWVPNGRTKNEHALVGWQLCKDRLVPPNFPKVYRVAEDGVLMEFVEGLQPREWNEEQAVGILDQLRSANVFHRDIRLANLIERPDGNWCLLDFGWACDYDEMYEAPWFLGAEGRKARGVQDDAYAMDVVKQTLTGK